MLRYPWRSAPIAGLVGLSAVFWGLFVARMLLAVEPLIPPGILRNPVIRMGTLAACFGMGTYIGLTVYLPVYFETVRGLTASQSGLALIPLGVGTVMGATLSGRSMARITHYKRLPIAGLLVAIVATALLAGFAARLPLVAVEGLLLVLSVGLGTLLPVTTVAIQNAVPLHELGTATGTANFFRSLGGAIIVALFGAIVIGSTGTTGATSFETLAASAARSGVDLADVFRSVFAAATCGFALAFLFMALMKEMPLRSSCPEGRRGGRCGLSISVSGPGPRS